MPGLYSQAKVFRFGSKVDDLLSGRHSAPLHVRLKPTNRCNHDCDYCCFRCPDLTLGERMNPRDEIPVHRMAAIAKDLVDMGVKAVTFSGGGEPLVYPAFEETARVLLDGGVKVAVLTNGALLKGSVADLLGERATWVRVSMDAASAHDYARTRKVGPGEFDRVCANIRNFARSRSGPCQLGVNYVVTRDNHGDTFRFLELMKELGADHVKVSEAVTSIHWEENRRYVASFHESVRVALDRARAELEDPDFKVVDRVLDPHVDRDANPYSKRYSRCPFIQCLTVIAADLNVYTCQDKAYTDSGWLGSLEEQGFRELWYHEDTVRRLQALDPSRACNHHCVAHEKNLLLLDFLEADGDHLEFV